jgi:hypothetical protein
MVPVRVDFTIRREECTVREYAAVRQNQREPAVCHGASTCSGVDSVGDLQVPARSGVRLIGSSCGRWSRASRARSPICAVAMAATPSMSDVTFW